MENTETITTRGGAVTKTPLQNLPEIFAKAKTAQAKWAAFSPKKRSFYIFQICEALIDQSDSVIELITRENGKPNFESISNEVLPVVSLLRFFARKGPKILRDKTIPMTLMKHRTSYLNFWPMGTIAIIAPWNYPFSIPFGEIAMALIAGNAVIFKPSELTPSIGLKIQNICDNAGLPADLLQTVIGDGVLGAAIIEQKPAKIFFTGSVMTGKKILQAASKYMIPVNLELGGKDAMIILPDADLDYATSAALWGGFSNSGQTCSSTERLLIHESINLAFLDLLKKKISQLGKNELGIITSEKQKEVYSHQIAQAKDAGANFLMGGELNSEKNRLQPTIVTGPEIEKLEIYQEESFGPIIAVTTFKTTAEAVLKTNDNRYGLSASIITQNIPLAEEIAKQLEVGTVTINEVTYTHGLPETPWGGVKDSGIGRSHSAQGLYEFVYTRHIHKPLSTLFIFKSLWWFPYTEFQYKTFNIMVQTFRKSLLDRLKVIPHFLWHLVQLVKTEKRL